MGNKHGKKALDGSYGSSEDDNPCSICFGSIETHVMVTPCKHYFHLECISEWLGNSNTCPICRHENITLDKCNYHELVTTEEGAIVPVKVPSPTAIIATVPLAYKNCNLVRNDGRPIINATAIVTMRFTMSEVMTERDMVKHVRQLVPGSKYRTTHPMEVVSIEICSDLETAHNIYKRFYDYSVRSYHDPTFEYRVGDTVVANDRWARGNGGIVSGCGVGIHFYVDKDSAINHQNKTNRRRVQVLSEAITT